MPDETSRYAGGRKRSTPEEKAMAAKFADLVDHYGDRPTGGGYNEPCEFCGWMPDEHTAEPTGLTCPEPAKGGINYSPEEDEGDE